MKLTCFKPTAMHTACGDTREQEADYFARCLLMPQDKFSELVGQGYTIDELSTFFCVPKGQVSLRIDELGLDYDSIQAEKLSNFELADSASTALVGGGLLALAGFLFL